MNSYLDKLREQVSEISKKEGRYADLYLQSGVSHSVRFEDQRMDQLSSSRSDGCGARIIVGENTFYSHGTGVDLLSVNAPLRRVGHQVDVDIPEIASKDSVDLMNVTEDLDPLECSFMRGIDQALRKESSLIRQITLGYRTAVKNVLILRGDGEVAADRRVYTSFTAGVVVQKDGIMQTAYEPRSMALSVDRFWGNTSPEEIALCALQRALLMLDATSCPAGKMDVILAGEAGGTMIHEACGHGLEADIIQKDFSVYSDSIGKLVASPLISLVDDATLQDYYGSYGVDDEGNPASRTLLIENGVLRNYLTDILSSRVGGLPLTGNGRRESSQYAPLPRMSNTFVLPGKTKTEEMLDQVKLGLYVKKMGGGEVDPTSGDYVFYVTEGYLIKNGKIGSAVRGATLTGNGPETLKNIAAVGEKYYLEPGICGKSGQSIPVTDGQPTLFIRNMIVGGSDTNYGASE